MRQSEFKKKYNPVTGKFTKQHVWNSGVVITGEGITDKFKSLIGRKKTQKNPTSKTKHTNSKKAGDKIVQILGGVPPPKTSLPKKSLKTKKINPNNQHKINAEVLRSLAG